MPCSLVGNGGLLRRAGLSVSVGELEQVEAAIVLHDHIAALRATPAASQLFADGWDVGLVDIRVVSAFEQVVFSEQVVERVAAIAPADVAIAEEMFPGSSTTELPMQYDQVRNAWMISSANLNLRIVGLTTRLNSQT